MVRETLDFVFGHCLASQLEKCHQEGQRWLQRNTPFLGEFIGAHTSHIILLHPLRPVILNDFCLPVIRTTGRVQSNSYSFTCAAQNLHLKMEQSIFHTYVLRISSFLEISGTSAPSGALVLFCAYFCNIFALPAEFDKCGVVDLLIRI